MLIELSRKWLQGAACDEVATSIPSYIWERIEGGGDCWDRGAYDGDVLGKTVSLIGMRDGLFYQS
jgi:hypothetical protein